MTATAKKKKRRRSIYFEVKRVVIPETGESVGALVPSTYWDQRAMRERKFSVGTLLRGELVRSRNAKFFRKAHVLGAWLADNVEGFEGLAQHDAVKRLQELSGIGCIEESFEMDMGALGIVQAKRIVAESLNFEDMDEGRWCELWDGGNGEGGWLGWLRREKWGLLSSEQIEDVEALLRRKDEAA
jgi:hypothetical protein